MDTLFILNPLINATARFLAFISCLNLTIRDIIFLTCRHVS